MEGSAAEKQLRALRDLRHALDLLAPVEAEYAHNARWGDGIGFSHARSALLKTSLSLPVVDGELALGAWQQVVAITSATGSGSESWWR